MSFRHAAGAPATRTDTAPMARWAEADSQEGVIGTSPGMAARGAGPPNTPVSHPIQAASAV